MSEYYSRHDIILSPWKLSRRHDNATPNQFGARHFFGPWTSSPVGYLVVVIFRLRLNSGWWEQHYKKPWLSSIAHAFLFLDHRNLITLDYLIWEKEKKSGNQNIQQLRSAGDHPPTTNQSVWVFSYGRADGISYFSSVSYVIAASLYSTDISNHYPSRKHSLLGSIPY